MTLKFRRFAALLVLLACIGENAQAQIYDQYIYGSFNTVFMTGSTLFNNFLQSDTNGLSELFPANITPEGTTVSLWNPTTAVFDITSTFMNGSWTTNLILSPGTGVLIFAPTSFTNVTIGYALNHDGTPLTVFSQTLTLPPIFTGSNGIYLLGDKTPIDDAGTNIFLNILGRFPFVGEQVITLTTTNTYLGNGAWDSVPVIDIGEAAFLNIKTEPPPSLTIFYTNQQTIISWPSYASDWTLQTNINLTAGTWGKFVGTIVNNTVTNAMPSGNLFFRLYYP